MTDENPKDTLAPYRARLAKMSEERLEAEVRKRRDELYASEEEARSFRREANDHDALDAMSFRVSEDRARLALAERELQCWQETKRRAADDARAVFERAGIPVPVAAQSKQRKAGAR